jgi:hypothetical protein
MTRDGRFLRLSAMTMAGLRGPSGPARPLGAQRHAQMPVADSLAEGVLFSLLLLQ